ncbi:Copper amine oxidase N-terminal domain-containing protein [Peptoclostridium litorale DSM 5388]|uniref:Copper amine oxidase-like N-terminal domain-containing protein n=1 Tax=Peptoclostridium litorale DSM 5388 TaxID=1121324 RepID=A0A069RFC5_PEPLI|nr:DUF5050 domain-containing protein [Peptoclostridium litorale]KDR95493.1 hypothetical protein CLIT_10c02200 [Peptoclostridium litorale DSM 5388]SIO17523.1 Copper amine oxidase N-terminal domain-containing protein [Peptoclostridium litorale DSM 5388]
MYSLFKKVTATAMLIIALGASSVFADFDKLNETLQHCVILKVSRPYALAGGGKKPIDRSQGGTSPFISDGRTFVPARFISEAFGAAVDWDSASSTVTVSIDGDTISFRTGSSVMCVNSIEKQIDAPAQLVNGRIFIPLRTLSESLEKSVRWVDGIIFISDNEPVIQESDMKALGLFFNEDIRGNTSSNMRNGGFVCTYDGWIYYVNESDSRKIYRMRDDKTGIEKVSDIECVQDINIANGFIYAFGGLEGTLNDGIYKININSFGEYDFLIADPGNSTVVGDYIYYIDYSGDLRNLCRIKTDGTEPEVLYGKDCNSFEVAGENIYFTDEVYIGGGSIPTYTLYKMDIYGKTLQKIEDTVPFGITVVGDWMYYDCGDIGAEDMFKLFKYNLITGEKIKLTDRPAHDYNMYEDFIYYTTSSLDGNDEMDEMHRISLDGLEDTKIKIGKFFEFNIAGDWIYYTVDHEGRLSFHRMKLDGSNVQDFDGLK